VRVPGEASARSIRRADESLRSAERLEKPGRIIVPVPLPGQDSSNRRWAGLLASGSSDRLRLPASILPAVARAAVIPGYSGGTATDLHRFPYSSTALPARPTPISPGSLSRARATVNEAVGHDWTISNVGAGKVRLTGIFTNPSHNLHISPVASSPEIHIRAVK